MNDNIETAIQKLTAFEASAENSDKLLAQGLQALASAIGEIDNRLQDIESKLTESPVEIKSAVDILTNNELAQTISDLKASIQSFLNKADKKQYN